MHVPSFDALGCLPAIRPGGDGVAADRSPYATTVVELVRRFGTTSHRRRLLFGLLDFRAGLRERGLSQGFQWLDGSFVEDCEAQRRRPPADIDVVTFVRPPPEADARAVFMNARAFLTKADLKHRYHVDNYVVRLDLPMDAAAVRTVAYWYSMWSHRRSDQRWKGFVQVDLEADDHEAYAALRAAGAGDAV